MTKEGKNLNTNSSGLEVPWKIRKLWVDKSNTYILLYTFLDTAKRLKKRHWRTSAEIIIAEYIILQKSGNMIKLSFFLFIHLILLLEGDFGSMESSLVFMLY